MVHSIDPYQQSTLCRRKYQVTSCFGVLAHTERIYQVNKGRSLRSRSNRLWARMLAAMAVSPLPHWLDGKVGRHAVELNDQLRQHRHPVRYAIGAATGPLLPGQTDRVEARQAA